MGSITTVVQRWNRHNGYSQNNDSVKLKQKDKEKAKEKKNTEMALIKSENESKLSLPKATFCNKHQSIKDHNSLLRADEEVQQRLKRKFIPRIKPKVRKRSSIVASPLPLPSKS